MLLLLYSFSEKKNHLIGLMVKACTLRAADPWFDSCFFRGDFSGLSHTSNLNTGIPVAALPGIVGSAWGLVGLLSVYCDLMRFAAAI